MNKLNEEITALVKAINQIEELSLETKDLDTNFFLQNQRLFFEKTLIIPSSENKNDIRSISDLAICYKKFHNKEIHQREKNKQILDEREQKLIDDFEKIRIISKMKDEYFGLTKNILEKIDSDIDFVFINQDFEKFQLILLDEIFKDSLFGHLKTNIGFIKENVDKKIIKKIKEVAKTFQNQQDFIEKTKDFLDFLRQESENQQKTQEKSENQEKNSPQEQNNKDFKQEESSQDASQAQNQEKEVEESKKEKPEIRDFKNDQDFSQIKTKNSPKEKKQDKIEFINKYKFYTNKYDEIIIPSKITNKEELDFLRFNLDKKIEQLTKISKRLKLKLKKKLLAKQHITIEKSESEGILDRKKLTQIILNPFEKNFFIKENHHNYQDTIITILLDNSGSMRGSPIVMAALACEILTEILESFNIKTEILGFTTADWKGGKSRKLWERENKPQNPGRINDLRHIIYKSANQSFKKAKINLGLMLKEGILKENIDGEALLWAKSRLLQREENRKILMVISDGTPVDDSTNSLNDKNILIDHLHHTISRIEKENKIELVGIGIGHNVGEFYQNSITIKNIEELGDVMISKLIDLI